VGSRWCNDECVLLKCGIFGFSSGVMMSENPQSTTLEENTRIITQSGTHNLLHLRKTHSSLHHSRTQIYHTLGEHTHHYTTENPQSTTLEENTLIITPSLECGRLWVLNGNDESVLLVSGRVWVLAGVMMSVFSWSVVDCGFSMV
jgi:hypothetical protein